MTVELTGKAERMNDKLNEPQVEPNEYAAFVGIDWADQEHAWALQAAQGGRIERGQLNNTPEAMQQWARELERRFGGRPIAVA